MDHIFQIKIEFKRLFKKIFSSVKLKYSQKFFILSLTLLSLILNSNRSIGCIWQYETRSQTSPFWPSNTIEVCFLPPNPVVRGVDPNPLDQVYIDKYYENMNTIKLTYEAQFNQRTPINFIGFKICEIFGRDIFDLDYKIRIDLNDIQGNGAKAASIGPKSGTYGVNIFMSSLEFQWPNNEKPDFESGNPIPLRVRVFNSSSHMSSNALHEVMHLIGFHHTESWNESFGSVSDALSVIQVGSQPDLQSVMNRGVRNFDENGLAILSTQDIQCLNKIADQSIINLPSRPANL